MKLKQKIEDFRVRELLALDLEGNRGEHRVYRVTKRKLTSLEAAGELAREAGVHPQAVSMAGLKDRQGVTIQHMSVPRGPVVDLRRPDLRIETLGHIPEELGADASDGNAFQIVVRALDVDDLQALRTGLAEVRRDGFVNYFDEQRFGNLRHGQGWICLDLIQGRVEEGLRKLLAAPSRFDDGRTAAFKRGLREVWGDWRACRDLAGKFGAHHSLFEHLKASPEDFAGAFGHVATRLRLIHLYAFQSHLWNRAVAELVRELTPIEERIVVSAEEGPLVFSAGPVALPPSFPLPGERLAGADERARALLADVLASLRLVPADLAIEGVPGFALKAEERATLVHPRHLRVRPAEPDEENPGLRKVRVRFELPRGAYATLLVRRLLSRALGERDGAEPGPDQRGARPDRGRPRSRDERARSERRGGERRDQREGRDRDRGNGPRGSWHGDRGPRFQGSGQRDARRAADGGAGGGARGAARSERGGSHGDRRSDRGEWRGGSSGWRGEHRAGSGTGGRQGERPRWRPGDRGERGDDRGERRGPPRGRWDGDGPREGRGGRPGADRPYGPPREAGPRGEHRGRSGSPGGGRFEERGGRFQGDKNRRDQDRSDGNRREGHRSDRSWRDQNRGGRNWSDQNRGDGNWRDRDRGDRNRGDRNRGDPDRRDPDRRDPDRRDPERRDPERSERNEGG